MFINQFANYQLPVESNYSTSIPSPNPIYPRSVNDLSISLRSTTLPSMFLGSLLILFLRNLSLLQQPIGIYIFGELESSPNSSSLSGIYVSLYNLYFCELLRNLYFFVCFEFIFIHFIWSHFLIQPWMEQRLGCSSSLFWEWI